MHTDVQAMGADFYAFSGHKLYGPTGTGVLWARADLLEAMPPWKGGGDMILSVSFARTDYAPPPHKFEAGTPNIAGVIGLGAAVDWFTGLDSKGLDAHEAEMLAYGTEGLMQVPGLKLIGTAKAKCAVLSFVLDYAHPHDIGTILDSEGVAVRTGHHCAQPVMEHFDIAATVRPSIGAYTCREDIDQLIAALGKVREMFG
jgi:cysteine desulfurase/selenocysteine lyase